jgi:hypothetical protein
MDISWWTRGIFTAEYRQYQEIYDKLEEILLPLKKSFSRQEKRLLLKTAARLTSGSPTTTNWRAVAVNTKSSLSMRRRSPNPLRC